MRMDYLLHGCRNQIRAGVVKCPFASLTHPYFPTPYSLPLSMLTTTNPSKQQPTQPKARNRPSPAQETTRPPQPQPPRPRPRPRPQPPTGSNLPSSKLTNKHAAQRRMCRTCVSGAAQQPSPDRPGSGPVNRPHAKIPVGSLVPCLALPYLALPCFALPCR
ncbi:hypothetical protein F5144DRAFT_162352 [Chaetomium tenue]|uniref:Uncharacterized protein n=1 Tax=Chaetomium tenue TaxID=1854479 RepID=A0ACB7P9Z2_9PEZI|nr:hypothetical protein F5144DRAFT_162352 [Chaetomium globosum]